jgi:hypothetical protein
MKNVSRLTKFLLVLTAMVTFGVMAQAASATSGAHFFSTSGTVTSSGALNVGWDEAGVGNATVNYNLTTDASALYACINGGGNHPKAANKQSVNGPITSPTTGVNPINGRVKVALGSTDSIFVGPLASTLVCPSGQTFVLACVKYTNTVIHDLTNGVDASVADQARTFVNITGCPIP